jgi:hypothetical protein
VISDDRSGMAPACRRSWRPRVASARACGSAGPRSQTGAGRAGSRRRARGGSRKNLGSDRPPSRIPGAGCLKLTGETTGAPFRVCAAQGNSVLFSRRTQLPPTSSKLSSRLLHCSFDVNRFRLLSLPLGRVFGQYDCDIIEPSRSRPPRTESPRQRRSTSVPGMRRAEAFSGAVCGHPRACLGDTARLGV